MSGGGFARHHDVQRGLRQRRRSGRFAFHYSVANALDASYIGIDSVSVSAVPEPTTLALLAFGLAAIGAKPRHPSALSAIPASH